MLPAPPSQAGAGQRGEERGGREGRREEEEEEEAEAEAEAEAAGLCLCPIWWKSQNTTFVTSSSSYMSALVGVLVLTAP